MVTDGTARLMLQIYFDDKFLLVIKKTDVKDYVRFGQISAPNFNYLPPYF